MVLDLLDCWFFVLFCFFVFVFVFCFVYYFFYTFLLLANLGFFLENLAKERGLEF